MKLRITTVALAAVLATPALAQTTQSQPRPVCDQLGRDPGQGAE